MKYKLKIKICTSKLHFVSVFKFFSKNLQMSTKPSPKMPKITFKKKRVFMCVYVCLCVYVWAVFLWNGYRPNGPTDLKMVEWTKSKFFLPSFFFYFTVSQKKILPSFVSRRLDQPFQIDLHQQLFAFFVFFVFFFFFLNLRKFRKKNRIPCFSKEYATIFCF